MNDPVMHPEHYSRWKMEAIEFIAINNLCWWLANVIKYCMRYDAKDGLQDLYKARSYLDMQIRLLEGHPRFWEKPVGEQLALKSPETQQFWKSYHHKEALKDSADFYLLRELGLDAKASSAAICHCGMVRTDAGDCWDDDCAHKQGLK